MPGLGTGPGCVLRYDVIASRPPPSPALDGYTFFATDVNGGTWYWCTWDGDLSHPASWVQITGGIVNLTAGTDISLVSSPGLTVINNTYSLPIASGSQLGGIKVGPNLSIDVAGVLSGAAPYSLPIASPSILGGIKVGSNLSIDGAGVLSGAAPYTLPIASPSILGGIKVGSGLSIDGGGVLSAAGGGGGGMDYQGAWSGAAVYDTNDVVVYKGVSYIATSSVSVTANTEAAYQTLVLADSPVAFWPLTESGTSIGSAYADVTGNGYGVVVKTGNVTHTTGIFPLTSATTAPLFNNNDALWTNTTLGLPVDGSAYSIEGWIQPQTDYKFMAWMAYGPTNFSGKSIGSDMQCGRLAIIETDFPTNFQSSTLSFNLNTGRWRHVVWTDDGAGNIKLYIDGVLIQTFSGGASNGVVYNVSNVLFLGDPGLVSGSYPAPLQEPYKGGLSHLAIYNVALTSTQVTNHYNASALLNPSPDTAPSVWSRLDDDATYVTRPAVKVYSSQNQSFLFAHPTDVIFDTVEFDVGTPNGHWDGTSILYAYESGYYEVYAGIIYGGSTGTRTTSIQRSNGTNLISRTYNFTESGGFHQVRITTFLNAGDGIKLNATSSQTTTPQILTLKNDTNAVSPVLMMVKLD